MKIETLVIEVTRECNFECNHCMRGKSQCKNIDLKHIQSITTQVDSIDHLLFTGGEPFLNPEAIRYTINQLMAKKVYVGDFFIATNGMIFDVNIMHTLNEFRLYCDFPENCSVSISYGDGWHDDCLFGLEYQHFQKNLGLFEGYSFYSEVKKSIKREYDGIIPEGYGSQVASGFKDKPVHTTELCFYEDMITDVYLNATGWINNNCDMSYYNQGIYRICPVEDLTTLHKKLMAEAS